MRPKEAWSASWETERLMRSKKLTMTPNASKNAMGQRFECGADSPARLSEELGIRDLQEIRNNLAHNGPECPTLVRAAAIRLLR